MRFRGIALGIALLAPGLASAYDLNERLLGLTNVPYKVGQVLTSEQAASLKCTPSATDLLVCPIPTHEPLGFSVMLAKADGGFRVSSVLSYRKCGDSACPEVMRKTVATLSKQLGAQPEQLNGVPIWKDRERHQRDLMVTAVGPTMVAIVLAESK